MAKTRPVRIPTGDGKSIDSLLNLLPDTAMSDWREDLAQLKGWYDQAIVGQSMDYPAMFWPAFVECDDCVLLAARSPGSLIHLWLDREQGDRQAVEAELNSAYMRDLFTGYPLEPTRDQVIWLARLVKRMWGWKLHHEFINRRFVVKFDERALDVLHSYITFHQIVAR